MRGVVGTKHYDTEKSELIKTDADGLQIYRKRTRPTDFFRFDPNGRTAREKFRDLTPEEALELIPENTASQMASNNSNTIRFRPYDLQRIREHATKCGMTMNNFLIMLVGQYEDSQK